MHFRKIQGLLFFVVCWVSALFSVGNSHVNEKNLNVGLRSIADEFLLQHGDSTTRILPIEKEGERYLIQFDNELAFEPDMLSYAAIKVSSKHLFVNKFIIETEKCSTSEVVHSFKIDIQQNDNMIPCKSRPLPKDCYKIYFTIIETPISKELNKTELSILFPIGLGGLFIVLVFFVWNKRATNAPNSEFLQIGEYQFDKKGMRLIYKGNSEELSGKEADLLALLYDNDGETLERDFLLNKVWGDEGDYVGRTLDVFISKLRKKLEQDPKIQIINVRGVGYRFAAGE